MSLKIHRTINITKLRGGRSLIKTISNGHMFWWQTKVEPTYKTSIFGWKAWSQVYHLHKPGRQICLQAYKGCKLETNQKLTVLKTLQSTICTIRGCRHIVLGLSCTIQGLSQMAPWTESSSKQFWGHNIICILKTIMR